MLKLKSQLLKTDRNIGFTHFIPDTPVLPELQFFNQVWSPVARITAKLSIASHRQKLFNIIKS